MQSQLKELRQQLTSLHNKQNALWMERTRLTLEMRMASNGGYVLRKNRIQAINNELATIEKDVENVNEKISKISR